MKLLTLTPYYAQANGQVEATNKILISLIKKHTLLKTLYFTTHILRRLFITILEYHAVSILKLERMKTTMIL